MTWTDSGRAPARGTTSGLLGGTMWGVAAEAVALPAALAMTVLLTRHLGPTGYGAYALAATLVMFAEMNLNAFLAQATVRFVRVTRTADRARVETTCLRLYLGVGTAAAAALQLGGDAIGDLLDAPELGAHLRLFAPGLVLVAAAAAHEHVLVGRGAFRTRAAVRVTGWAARLLVLLPLVHVGIDVEGAIAVSLCGWAASLALARCYARPALWGSAAAWRPVVRFALPLLMSGLALRVFSRLDLVALKGLGASLADTGLYVAAQNLALVPAILMAAFIPLMVSDASAAHAAGDAAALHGAARDALRVPLLAAPFTAIAAGAADPLVHLVYGTEFAAAGHALRLLLVGGAGLAVVSVGTGLLAAAGRPGLTTSIAMPMLALAGAGLVVAVPEHGMTGAAAVIAGVSVAGACGTLAVVHRATGALPAARTVLGAGLAGAAAYALASRVHVGGVALVATLAVLALASAVALRVLGAVDAADMAALRAAIRPAGVGGGPVAKHP